MSLDGLQSGSSPSLTAYVIMRPADPSQSLSGPITSENVGALQPTPEAVQRVTTLCAARGFDVGPFVGISFAITGPPELFSSVFHQTGGGDLELDHADPAVTDLIETVVLDEAAELFGPASTPSEQGVNPGPHKEQPITSDQGLDSNDTPGEGRAGETSGPFHQ